jgi:spore maturation protein CgeB
MALNLSRGLPFKWYSSDRISSFIPNGITTFIDRATKLDDFFSDDEVVFYKNINDLGNLIHELKNNDKKRRSIGQKGRVKYNTHFNSTKVTKFIFEKTLNLKLSEKYYWDK